MGPRRANDLPEVTQLARFEPSSPPGFLAGLLGGCKNGGEVALNPLFLLSALQWDAPLVPSPRSLGTPWWSEQPLQLSLHLPGRSQDRWAPLEA